MSMVGLLGSWCALTLCVAGWPVGVETLTLASVSVSGGTACNVLRFPPDIKNMNALVILLLLLTGSYFVTQLGKWAIESYYQSAYYYVKVNRNRGRVRR